ncbi:RnfABCDGE type electron transport complex subunit B [Shigella flexneri]
MEDDPVVEKIDEFLPQSQCGQCGYPVVALTPRRWGAGEKINCCAPGGEAVMPTTAELLKVDPQLSTPKRRSNGLRVCLRLSTRVSYWCTKCIQACPADVIVGATRAMHTVMSDLCTGLRPAPGPRPDTVH